MKQSNNITSKILKLIPPISGKIEEISANLIDRPSTQFCFGDQIVIQTRTFSF